MKNLTNSAKFSRFVGQFLTYFYMVVLSIIIIYPLLITVSSAFKAGNVTAFSLDLGMQWSLDNFTRLFNETKYLSWYRNTLFVATTTMVCKSSLSPWQVMLTAVTTSWAVRNPCSSS